MKLDEEMRARCDAAYREFATAAEGKFVDGVSHMFLAGYRMGLERAARVITNTTIAGAPPESRDFVRSVLVDIAAAIRGMAHD